MSTHDITYAKTSLREKCKKTHKYTERKGHTKVFVTYVENPDSENWIVVINLKVKFL